MVCGSACSIKKVPLERTIGMNHDTTEEVERCHTVPVAERCLKPRCFVVIYGLTIVGILRPKSLVKCFHDAKGLDPKSRNQRSKTKAKNLPKSKRKRKLAFFES